MKWTDDFLNKIILGDCLDFMPDIPDGVIDLIVTSPPYNCRKPYEGYEDEVSWGKYYEFLGRFLDEAYRVLIQGGTLAINLPLVIRWQRDHKYAHTWATYDPDYQTHRGDEMVTGKGRIEPVGIRCFEMMLERDIHVREPIVWAKGSVGNPISTTYQMGCDSDPYARPTHEHILLGSKGQWFHRGGTGRRGKDAVPFMEYTKDVWWIPGTSDKEHPAVFPQDIPERLIRLFVHAKDAIILDPFAGVGTTLVAALELDYDFVGIEISPTYCEVARDRTQDILAQPKLCFG